MISELLTATILGQVPMIMAMVTIAILGSLVWAHHMNTAGLDTDTRAYFNLITVLIAIPTGTKIFSWLSCSNDLACSSVQIFMFIFLFILGGATGVLLGSAAFDTPIHDTYYVLAHFHYILSLAVVMGIILVLA